jgi:glucose/arabinose dehydrogenase
MNRTTIYSGACILMFTSASAVLAQEQKLPQGVDVSSSTFRSERRDFNEEYLSRLQLPPDFKINVFAKDVGKPRMIVVADDGTIYITRRTNDVVALKDTDGDGKSDEMKVVLKDLPQVHGIALRGNQVYLATPAEVWLSERTNDDSLSTPRKIAEGLPNGGQHSSRTLGIGPDNMLYINVGSTCNNCIEVNKESATMQRMALDGKSRSTFAKGLRNTLGFSWHPQTHEMWGMDHGTDFLGNDVPPEELNRLSEGKDYGWPRCFGQQRIDPTRDKPEGMTREQFCAKTEPAALDFPAHSSPLGFVFYTGSQFPAEYRNDAFVALHGSWNRNPPSGFKIVHVKFENGKATRYEDFVTGFTLENGAAQFARPTGLAIAKDGALLLTDDSNGVVYRIAYAGSR